MISSAGMVLLILQSPLGIAAAFWCWSANPIAVRRLVFPALSHWLVRVSQIVFPPPTFPLSLPNCVQLYAASARQFLAPPYNVIILSSKGDPLDAPLAGILPSGVPNVAHKPPDDDRDAPDPQDLPSIRGEELLEDVPDYGSNRLVWTLWWTLTSA